MNENDLEKLSIEELINILKLEEEKNVKFSNEISSISETIEITERKNEILEERLLNKYQNQIRHLKSENSKLYTKIQNEEKYIFTKLAKKENELLNEKEKLEQDLYYQEFQVIATLQQQIDQISQEFAFLETEILKAGFPRPEFADESIKIHLSQIETTEKDYTNQYGLLRTEIENLRTEKSILEQRISTLPVILSKSRRGSLIEPITQLKRNRRNTE